MKTELTLKEIEYRLQPTIYDIKKSLLTRGFICEGEFPLINHMIWNYNITTLIKYLQNETNLNLFYNFDDELMMNYVLYDCDKYTAEEAKLIPRKIYPYP